MNYENKSNQGAEEKKGDEIAVDRCDSFSSFSSSQSHSMQHSS